MSSSICGRSFNVRISFDEKGMPVIGAVLGFYAVDSDCYDILPVPDTSVLAIAKALSITKSSRSLLVNRKTRSQLPVEESLEIVSL